MAKPGGAPIETRRQLSAGGVVFRRRGSRVDVAIVRVGAGDRARWQLPKGIVEEGESPELAAQREVREEGGVEAQLVAPLRTIEYWYVGSEPQGRVRYHKLVHFYLFEYERGDVADHDYEVAESRWASLGEAAELLAFRSEREVLAEAAALLTSEEEGEER